jgi:glycosyltransferase involved in cell wall biosynthesis
LEAFALCRNHIENSFLRMKVAGVKSAFHPVFAAQAQAFGVGDYVDFLPYVTDEQMRELYRGATALLMPSLAEGFGIPVLEAMASGIPVAASRAASLPEVGGEAALYFEPTSAEQMAQVLHQIIFDSRLRVRMVELGRIQAQRFHPDVVREEIQALWKDIGQTAGPARTWEFASC